MVTYTSIDTPSDKTNATLSESISTMASPPPPSTTPCGFLSLPAELRNQIYEDVIDDHHDNRNRTDSPTPIPLLAVNKQIRHETLVMFWHKMSLRHVNTIAMPNQAALLYRMPKHIAQNIGNAQFIFVTDGFFGATSLIFILEHDQYRLVVMLGPNRWQFRTLSLAILRYEAWKAIGQIESWMEKNGRRAGAPLVQGATYRKYPVVISGPPEVRQFRSNGDPLYLRIIGCIAGETHLFLLRHQHQIDSIWRRHRVKLLIACALLWLLVDYTAHQFSPILRELALVIVPTIIRFLIETRPWTEKEWILRKTQLFWVALGLYYPTTVILAIVLTRRGLGVWEWLFVFICPILGLFG